MRRLLKFAVFSISASFAHAGHQGLQMADLTLGRMNHPATSFYQPTSVAVDPISGKVYVCDSVYHRVLRFPSSAGLAAGTPAEAVFGQPDLLTITPGLTQGKMRYPKTIACDSTGHLWVADRGNHRILRFDGAATKSSGALASGVLGQVDFTANAGGGTSATKMFSPSGLAIYGNDLYVSDFAENRILRFANAASKANGAAAQTVFGQPNMTSALSGTSANQLSQPTGIAIQAKATTLMLWVADSANSRVLGFEFPTAAPVTTSATKVLGQINFTQTGSIQANGSNLVYPSSVAFGAGSLYVSDTGHRRVMRWDSPDTALPGASASQLYGQPYFSSMNEDTFRFSGCEGITLDSTGALWISDTLNDHVLRYNSPKLKDGDDPADLDLWPTPGPGAKIMGTGIAIDPVTGKVYISERSRNRVHRYASYASLKTGSTPEAVFGQTTLTGGDPGDSKTQMWGPSAMVCSPSGHLWVADTFNDRVLRFDNAATKLSGSPADGVLGETTFGSAGGSDCTAAKFNWPSGLALEASGVLWVADTYNNRVLRFDNAHSKSNGSNADGVLGQFNYVVGTPGVSSRYMNNPAALTVSPDGCLWVFDCGNNRVLRYDNAAAKPLWSVADGVLGQPDFTSKAHGIDGSHFYSPSLGSLALDSAGRLYVGEQVNQRVLWFNAAAKQANGAPATGVLGQNDLDDQISLFDDRHLGLVWGLAFDPTGALWALDGWSDRVLRFSSLTPTLSSSGLDKSKHFFMSINTSPKSFYQIQGSPDLKNWTPIGATQKATYNNIFWIDPNIGSGKKFYRVLETAN